MPNRRQRSEPAARRIAQFFAQYRKFRYDPEAPVSYQFYRLLKTYGWEEGSFERQEAWDNFSKAMGEQFSMYYGSDTDDIKAWQALCKELRIRPVPDTIQKCKDIIESTHVNLVDFIDTRITKKPITIFNTEDALRDYTQHTHKYFPLEGAKESGVLRYLLRKIL